MPHSSTTAQGNAFRDSVARLLEITPGVTCVQTEFLVGTQPVDIYYEERASFRTLRVACECKDYGGPLTKSLIASKIYGRYRPLLEKGLVDAVRIITTLNVGSVARAYVEKDCGFSLHTADEIESQIIDFRHYLHGLRNAFAEDGLDQYYVRPSLGTGEDLETVVQSWITGELSQPVAVLGGVTGWANQLCAQSGWAGMALMPFRKASRSDGVTLTW